MKNMWSLLLFTITAIAEGIAEVNLPRNRVCVVGAGPSGLFSLKQLVDNINEFEPIVFEQNENIGGQWLYSDKVDGDEHGLPVRSNVYKYLRTNGPKELMGCPDYKGGLFGGENRSTIKHQTVLQYLKNYTDDYNLHQYIRLNTLVEKITPTVSKNHGQTTKWRVAVKNLNNNFRDVIICDSVIVSNGVYSKPYIPNIPGIDSFPGRVLHSQVYRRPEEFVDQTVVVLGASFSGRDIAFEISKLAKIVYLSHRHKKIEGYMPSNIIQVTSVIQANGSELILQDNSRIVVDSFIFCTGYKYQVPFLDASSGLEITDKRIFPLYKQIININYPSMGFVGLIPSIGTFCHKFSLQAKYFVAYLRGKVTLPSREEMMKDAEVMSPDKLPRYLTFDQRWVYLNQLAADAGVEPISNSFIKGVLAWADLIDKHPYTFRNYNLRYLEDGSVKIVKAEPET